jgi:hypothetical protein
MADGPQHRLPHEFIEAIVSIDRQSPEWIIIVWFFLVHGRLLVSVEVAVLHGLGRVRIGFRCSIRICGGVLAVDGIILSVTEAIQVGIPFGADSMDGAFNPSFQSSTEIVGPAG